MRNKTKIIAVAGPTASGKTALAVQLAKALGGEVISNDSMQIYKGMEIGTAAPREDEKCGVPHHLFSICTPDCDFSCAEYAAFAKQMISDVTERGKIPVFCGGTGLYLDAVMTIDSYSASKRDDSLRLRLTEEAELFGADFVHEKLQKIDPDAAAAIHKNNVRRVIRAIEIYETTGVTKTEWDIKSTETAPPYDAAVIVLDFLSRELLYERIDRRVDNMMKSGLEEEAKLLFDSGLLQKSYPAYQAIGYKEFEAYFHGDETLCEVTEKIKQNTRRYAKRQITWFKRYKNAIIIHPDCDNKMRALSSICDEAVNKINIFFKSLEK